MVPRPKLVLIDFRYYIVSITAIFLALGIGVVTGATVLDRVTVDALRGRLDDLEKNLNSSRADIKALRTDRDRANDLVDALSPRATEGALSGRQVMFVRGEATAGWEGRIQRAIRDAGASEVGTLVLTKKWTLDTPEALDDLRLAFSEAKLNEEDPRGSAARFLGRMLTDLGAPGLVRALGTSGFLRSSPARDVDPFPPPGVSIVVFGLPDDGWAAELARGAAAATATLVVGPTSEEPGPISALRSAGGAPSRLSTFDAGSDDRADIATVLALRAALDGKGGNFGMGRGLRYLPAPT